MDSSHLAENVRRIRQQLHMTQERLAQQAGVSLATCKKLEGGKTIPRTDTLNAVADAMGVSVFALLKPVRPLTHVRFRANKRLRTRKQILADVSKWLENYLELESILSKSPANDFLGEVGEQTAGIFPPEHRAVKAAELLRASWGRSDREPIRNICGLMGKHGVKVLSFPRESDDFFGLAVSREDGGPLVAVNTWPRITVERWIFSAAHELGHLILHPGAFNVDVMQEDKQEEKEANIFASYFLMPEIAFHEEFEALKGLPLMDIVLSLKRIFKVSYKTVILRFQQSGLTDDSIWSRFYSQYKQRYGGRLRNHKEPFPAATKEYAADFQEPDKLSPLDFPANHLKNLVREALTAEKITMSKASQILGVSIAEMRELGNDWAGQQVRGSMFWAAESTLLTPAS